MHNLFSKNKLLLLQLFYSNPGSTYYLQEIGKFFGKKGGVYQRALNELVKDKIITSFYRGNLRFFEINREYPLYNEVKSIILKTAGEKKVKNNREIYSADGAEISTTD